MKRIYLLTMVMSLAVFIVNAQNLKVGIKGGPNFAFITGEDEIEGDDIRIAYHFGAYADIVLSDKFSIQSEVLYSAQGTSYEDTQEDFGGGLIRYTDDKFILDYITVPVMGKFYPFKGFSIQAGPQIGFLLTAKNEYKANGEKVEEDFKDALKSTEIALATGLGYETSFGLNISTRFVLGLTDINDLPIGDEIKNLVIQLSLGYSFIK